MSDIKIELDVLQDELNAGHINIEWEVSFIESVVEFYDNHSYLTPKQTDKVHQLYEKYA